MSGTLEKIVVLTVTYADKMCKRKNLTKLYLIFHNITPKATKEINKRETLNKIFVKWNKLSWLLLTDQTHK